MFGDRTVSMLVDLDQWSRCVHTGTALMPMGGVELDWSDDDDTGPGCGPSTTAPEPTEPAGLAFDRWCRVYRSRPASHEVDVSVPGRALATSPCPGVIRRPRGLAVDQDQRLYVVESGTGSVLVVDTATGRLVRRVPVRPGRPLDVAARCRGALVLVRGPDGLVWLGGRRAARPGPRLVRPRCPGDLQPVRLTGGPFILWRGGADDDRNCVVADPQGSVAVELTHATDVELTPAGILVVGRGPGQSFRRFQQVDDPSGEWLELESVAAPGYDGGALASTPDGRVAYTTAEGYRTTAGSAARHLTTGGVVTYRLDSGTYQTRWGRTFVDACIPAGSEVTVRFLTSDLDEVEDPIEATPASRGAIEPARPELTPPLPSRALLDGAGDYHGLYRRLSGREYPWQQIAADDGFETYESPVAAPPGRYLWVDLRLSGTATVSPRVRALRVERSGHGLLGSLPGSWSRDDRDADFLQRFLAPLDGILHELDWRSAERAILLDPRVTPQEAMAWLAGFAGLVLDRRWPDEARRTLVAEAYSLFARRGTKAALVRMLEIYLGRAPAIVEQWQLRGLGGAVLGNGPGGPPAPVVGGQATATGTLGRFTVGGQLPGSDSYTEAAHRFTVLVPGSLISEQRSVVQGLLDQHRPAHTLCDICELGAGMRVGQRLRLRLTSFVGPGAGWAPAVVGATRVGGDGVVGSPAIGSRLDEDSRVGAVRVG